MADHALAPADAGLRALAARLRGGAAGGSAGLAALLAAIALGFSATVPGFAGLGTLHSVMLQLPLLGLLSLAMVVPLITGGLNLAIIATADQAALLMVWTLKVLAGPGASSGAVAGAAAAALLAGVLLCAAIGLVTGALVAYTGVHPILVTLGTRSLIDGVSVYLTRGEALSGVPAGLAAAGNASVLGVPAVFLVLAAAATALGLVLRRTPFGISCAMIGSNAEAARYSAIDTRRVLVGVYALSSLLCFLAALVSLVVFNSASADYGRSYLLVTILAAVLGGVDPFGGFGRVSGLMLALAILQVISSGFNQLGLSPYLTTAIWGLVLIAVMAFQTVRPRLAALVRRG